jgi:hypothetical protein
LNEQCLHTQWQQKVFSKLLGLQYKIVYKKGADNHVADALSRKLGSPELVDVSETCDDIFPISLNGCRQWWTIMSRINSLMIWLLS